MRKLKINELRQLIKEEADTDEEGEEGSEAVDEQHQPRAGKFKTPAEYIASGHEDTFLEVTGRLMGYKKLWEGTWGTKGVEEMAKQQARFSGGELSYHELDVGGLRFWLTIGTVLADYHDGSVGANVIEELESDGIIDGSFRRVSSNMGISLVALNGWANREGI